MIPDSIVILLLAVAFALSALAHYRMIGLPNSPALGWPFAIGLVALLAACGFLLLIVVWPDWGPRKPVFLGVGLILLGPAVAVFRQFWPRTMG